MIIISPDKHEEFVSSNTPFIGSNFDGENYIFFETEEAKKLYFDSLPKQPVEIQGSVAFEAFKQCSDEEKKLIAQSLKEYL